MFPLAYSIQYCFLNCQLQLLSYLMPDEILRLFLEVLKPFLFVLNEGSGKVFGRFSDCKEKIQERLRGSNKKVGERL